MNKEQTIRKVVILGGGSAGWITAGSLAAQFDIQSEHGLEIVLVESPDVKPIGVGEGTWPTMRTTLQHIGISEKQFLRECGASFKQGSKFVNWCSAKPGDEYYHPFVLPEGYGQADMYQAWRNSNTDQSFADFVCAQPYMCEGHAAPKQVSTPNFAGVLQYGYHLDAGKFSVMLQKHCTEKLGVTYVQDHVVDIQSHQNGDIKALITKQQGDIEGDLFIDCSGVQSLLLAKHFDIPFVRQDHVLFNDSAIATHIPYLEPDSDIQSATISTAQKYGWIWDIGLPSRRGAGYTYSSQFTQDTDVEKTLIKYAGQSIGQKSAESLSLRKISFTPGYYQEFWHKNCLAIGLSAGFIEPLEASALALVELSCNMLKDDFPATRQHMEFTAKRFNERFTYRWERVIEFLKLHYVLSQRTDSEYWIAHKQSDSIPLRLQQLLESWQYRSPSQLDFAHTEEVFPSASYQYVLYGMGFESQAILKSRRSDDANMVNHFLQQNQQKKDQFKQGLPSNRYLLQHICQPSTANHYRF